MTESRWFPALGTSESHHTYDTSYCALRTNPPWKIQMPHFAIGRGCYLWLISRWSLDHLGGGIGRGWRWELVACLMACLTVVVILGIAKWESANIEAYNVSKVLGGWIVFHEAYLRVQRTLEVQTDPSSQ